MKAKRLVAVLASAAMVTAVALPLAACKKDEGEPAVALGTTTLNLADYAAEYKSETSRAKGALKKVATYKDSEKVNSSLPGNFVVLNKGTTDEPKYTVINLATGVTVVTNLDSIPQYSYTNMGYNARVEYLQYVSPTPDDNDVYKVDVYLLDGTKILSIDSDYSQGMQSSSSYVYIDGKAERVYSVTVESSNGDKPAKTIYLQEVEDESTGEISFKLVNESKFELFPKEYREGEDLSGLISNFFNDEDRPVEGELKDYSIKVLGNTYTLYKNGIETGKLELQDGVEPMLLGNYVYYRTVTPVASDATSGYNYEAYGMKANYALHKYDILENTTTELNLDVMIDSIVPLYNYKTKAYDAAVIETSSKMVDGVFYETGTTTKYHIVDKDLNVAFTPDWLVGIGGYVEKISSVGNDKYLVRVQGDSYLVDKDFNLLTSRLRGVVYEEQGLISFRLNELTGFTDLSGTVVIAPRYIAMNYNEGITFCDGVAYVREMQTDGTQKEALLKADGSVTYIEDLEWSGDSKVVKSVIMFEDKYMLTTATYETAEDAADIHAMPESGTLEIFTYGGTSLKKVTIDYANATDYSLLPRLSWTDGNSVAYLIETTALGTDDYTVNVTLIGTRVDY